MATRTSFVQVDDDSYRDLLEVSSLVLLHFRADWCGPCNTAVEPVLGELAANHPELTVAEIDAEEGQAAIEAFDVDTLLTSVLFVDGDEVARFRGKTPYLKLERAVREHR